MKCVDITLTLNLDDMTKEEYDKKYQMLEEMSESPLGVLTYDPEKPWPQEAF